MNLQDLVPPLELCRAIPKGEFEDSALVWFSNYLFGGWHIEKRELAVAFTDNGELYPAPTLQEILVKFDYYKLECDYSVPCLESGIEYEYGEKLVESAMKLWLKCKGINNK